MARRAVPLVFLGRPGAGGIGERDDWPGKGAGKAEMNGRGALLEQHSIAYAPDFIANAGGLIYLCQEVAGWSAERVTSTLEGIFDTMSEVFAMASARAIPSSEAAVRIARDRLAARPPTASDKPRPTARS